MKVYTRGGDKGETSLFDGTRVPKSDPRVEVYGAIDELNAHVGVARAAAKDETLAKVLLRIQNELFTLGADFATPMDAKRQSQRATAKLVDALEKDTDAFFQQVGNPGGFVVPGETPMGAHLHVCRTVARRAEREAVRMAADTPVNPEAVRYLNRLSSLFYALAVWSDAVAGGKKLRNPVYD